MTSMGTLRPSGRQALLRHRLPLRWSLVLALGLLLVFAVVMPLVLPVGSQLPAAQDAVSDEGHATAAIAGRLSRSLSEAVDDVNGLAMAVGTTTKAQPLLDDFLAERARYQDLRVFTSGGTTLDVGQGLPKDVPLAGPPLELRGSAGREPLLVVRDTSGGAARVLGRYRASYLGFALQEPGARQRWVLDSQGRIVASSEGFRALEPMTDQAVLQAAQEARTDGSGSRDDVTDRRIYSWSPVDGEGPAAALDWVVVSVRTHASLGVADIAARRELILVAVLTGLLGVLLFGWYLITVVLPLRHLATDATGLADGDRSSQIVPRRLDEVGVTARHLERIRRELRERAVVRGPAAQATTADASSHAHQSDATSPTESDQA